MVHLCRSPLLPTMIAFFSHHTRLTPLPYPRLSLAEPSPPIAPHCSPFQFKELPSLVHRPWSGTYRSLRTFAGITSWQADTDSHAEGPLQPLIQLTIQMPRWSYTVTGQVGVCLPHTRYYNQHARTSQSNFPCQRLELRCISQILLPRPIRRDQACT